MHTCFKRRRRSDGKKKTEIFGERKYSTVHEKKNKEENIWPMKVKNNGKRDGGQSLEKENI